ncbi:MULTISPECIES: hypothetical protein [Bacillus cereus group]|uniref:hypothetical protein n=1 Tax=Bacillus cereus group TaxID=86661 RepID=UPI0003302FBD|nr:MULTISPECIES: hypothetical protein [Bacillus cereus group]EOO34107.1 hypothetical protein IKK_05749 [Bacillus mycoides]MED1042858.1 hypothetical protein [Bacillus mycoides]OSY00617.1 hypothetical protein S2E19_04572 [Bacillus mycoides]QWH97947.1 hypothetical protein EXW36_27905 [Bacillus mycoides]
MRDYAIYKNNLYRLNVSVNKLKLISNSNESIKYGFKELKFEQGFVSKVIYIKEVDINEVEMAYKLKYKVIYKEKEFVPWAIGKFILEINKIPLGTSDEKEARNYGFEKMEQFVFKKEVPIEEVDALIEIKEYILKFRNMNEKVTRIEQKDIRSYLKNLLE